MAVHHDFDSFELTPADYGFPMFYAGCTISFRLNNPEEGVDIVRDAIERLVCHLPFLAGLVVPSARKVGVMEVRPPGQGEAISDFCIIQHLPHLRLPSRMDSSRSKNVGEYDRNATLIMAPVHIAASPTDHPVMRSQINVLDDGIIVALFFNHMVIDGTGIGALLESLAACCNGTTCIPCNIECEQNTRENLLLTLERNKMPGHPEIRSPPILEVPTGTGHEEVHDSLLLDYKFFISGTKIKLLREHIQNLGSGFVSEDDILTAILWTCLGRSRPHRLSQGGLPASVCKLQRVVNVRHKLRPHVSPYYLGNCFIMLNEALTTVELGQEASDSETGEQAFARLIAPVARLLRSRLDKVDDLFIRDYLSHYETASDWANTSVHEPDIAVTSIRRLNIYGEYFGPILGKVEDFEMLPYMNPEGVCTIMPHRRAGDDAWEVGVTLGREDMERLRKNVKWRWLVDRESPLQVFEGHHVV
ncbi:putative acetyltransferase [Penicillium brasilianum]|uniref:Putative acetyltransferase n=1 Tax=Penicillium brasilianum TaxID=104259 RepID=A0A1S9RY34_PENBI|nr:putative acetyltransferase [Penicillium brasilianum]